MDVPLNVLLLEDNPADAELAVEELRKAGLSIQWRRVQTERDYLAALDSGLDLILADHSLPQYDSVRALDALKQRGLDVPFVVVSGSIEEELAVTLMKRGAADYILKDRLTRLGQAVAHALEKKKLRQEKRSAEQSLVLFRTLLDRTNDTIEIIDPATGRFLDINERACIEHGYTRAEYLNLTVLDVETTITQWPPAVLTEAQQTHSLIVQGVHRRKDGTTFPVEINVNYIRLERDYVVAVVRDITERKQAEAALRASEVRLGHFIVHAPAALAMFDLDMRYLAASRRWLTDYRLGDIDIRGRSHYEICPEIPERWKVAHRRGLEGEIVCGEDDRFERADGIVQYLRWEVRPWYDSDGTIGGIMMFTVDITERKQAEATLRASEERFRRITTNMLDMVSQTDAAGIVQYATPSNEKAFGFPLETFIGQSTFTYLHPDDRERAIAMFQNALATKSSGGGEFRFRHVDGHYLWLEVVGNVLVDDDGQACGTILASRDITERKRRDEQMHLQVAALEAAANGIVITDKQGDITWVNLAYTRMTGYTLAEVCGKNPRVLKSGKHGPEFYKNLWATILDENVWHGELVNRRKDGTIYFEEMTITPVCAGGNGITHFVAIKQDVTERKRTEESLRASEAKLKAISTAALDAIMMIDSDGNVIFWNPAAETIFGNSRSDILGKNLHALLAPHRYRSDFESGLTAFKHTGMGKMLGRVLELFAIHHDGHEFPVEVSLAPVFLDGQWCAVGVLRDITVRKKAEESLRLSEERFRNSFDFAGIAMGVMDLDGRFLQVNPACCAMLGYTEDELLHTSSQAITHPDDVSNDLKKRAELLTGTISSYQIEKRNIDKTGRVLWVLKTASLVRDAEGRPLQILAQVQDVTARKQTEDEIRTLNDELEQRVRNRTTQLEAANKELEAFAYSVSHDLRAPLRAIDGFSQALLEDYNDKLDAEGQDYLRRVRAATQRMGRLIDDILQLSRMTRSAMKREKVDLSALATHVVAELQAAEPQRHDVCIIIDTGLVTEGDSRLLEVVLTNLLGNAWKFTSKTEKARIEFGTMEREGQRAFFVRDNGAGFNMANADRLFGAFQRLHTEAEFPGTGIGLATVQRIIRRHGGQVWAEGLTGKGATFAFSLGPIGGTP